MWRLLPGGGVLVAIVAGGGGGVLVANCCWGGGAGRDCWRGGGGGCGAGRDCWFQFITTMRPGASWSANWVNIHCTRMIARDLPPPFTLYGTRAIRRAKHAGIACGAEASSGAAWRRFWICIKEGNVYFMQIRAPRFHAVTSQQTARVRGPWRRPFWFITTMRPGASWSANQLVNTPLSGRVCEAARLQAGSFACSGYWAFGISLKNHNSSQEWARDLLFFLTSS